MQAAGPGDRAWIEDRLRGRIRGAMFPLANLHAHGWESGAPRAMRFWLERPRGLLLGASREGMAMPVAVAGDPSAAAACLDGETLVGCLGTTGEVRSLLAALGLEAVAAKLDEDQPKFALVTGDLAIPSGPGELVTLSAIDRATAVEWRRDYLVEAVGEPETTARAMAEADIAGYLAAGSHRALVIDGVPVAMTGVNARLPEIVQIGGVWTPPRLRGRGHARRAVALHLAELRAAGGAAVRAYEAIGFRRIGEFSIVLFRDAVSLGS